MMSKLDKLAKRLGVPKSPNPKRGWTQTTIAGSGNPKTAVRIITTDCTREPNLIGNKESGFYDPVAILTAMLDKIDVPKEK